MCPAIHTSSRSWLRSSSTHEPSDPPLRIVLFYFCLVEGAPARGQRLPRREPNGDRLSDDRDAERERGGFGSPYPFETERRGSPRPPTERVSPPGGRRPTHRGYSPRRGRLWSFFRSTVHAGPGRPGPCPSRAGRGGGDGRVDALMILPQVHLRKPCYDFYFL